MTNSSRAVYWIDDELLRRFNGQFAQRDRGKAVEQMIRVLLAECDLLHASRRIESDPRFVSIREVSDDVDQNTGEAAQVS